MIFVFLLFAFASAGNVSAEPTQREMRRARSLFERAEAAAAVDDHLLAAQNYLEAYKLFPSADFLFNAAKMYRLADEPEKARRYFEEYLSLDPTGRGADQARTALEELPEVAALPGPKTENNSEPESEAFAPTAPVALVPSPRNRVVATHTERRTLVIPAVISTSSGAILAGLGIYYALRSKQISDEVSDNMGYDPDLEQRGKNASRNAYIFSGIGAAALIGGGILYVVGSPTSGQRDDTVSIAPTIHGDIIGAVASGQF